MKTVTTIFGDFDAVRAEKLARAYEENKTRNTFWFTAHTGQRFEILTSLAKHLLQHLKNEGLVD